MKKRERKVENDNESDRRRSEIWDLGFRVWTRSFLSRLHRVVLWGVFYGASHIQERVQIGPMAEVASVSM
jgi:hypothetical protein